MKKVIVNCKTGEESIVDLTAEEIAEMEATQALLAQQQAEREAEQEALAAAKQSAQDKLAELGLSDLEIAAITGA